MPENEWGKYYEEHDRIHKPCIEKMPSVIGRCDSCVFNVNINQVKNGEKKCQ